MPAPITPPVAATGSKAPTKIDFSAAQNMSPWPTMMVIEPMM